MASWKTRLNLNLFLTVSLLTFGASLAGANICGTDYQNFNPITSGLDFVTVQSSETLKPCILNTGLFLNYAANTLTYTKNYNNYFSGQKVDDRMMGIDLNGGIGIDKNWDAGINLQFVSASQVHNPYYTSYFKTDGLADVTLNSKYRLLGDDSGGVAVIGSLNFNQISDNPYTGSNPGPTLNLEVAADTTISSWALGVNLGYRLRNPGDPLPGVPFTPFKNQFIYSAAASYLFASIDTKFIAELIGAQVLEAVDQYTTARSQSSLEGLMGVKVDVNHQMAIHFGGGTALQSGTATPDWRVYTGVNFAWGPLCDTKPTKVPARIFPRPTPRPAEPVGKDDLIEPEPDVPDIGDETTSLKVVESTSQYYVVRLRAEVLFDFNSEKIRRGSHHDLEMIHDHLIKKGFNRLIIEGHTDSIGSASYNLELSQRRAEEVRRYLIERHSDLPPGKIEATGYGKTKPVADNGNYQGRQQNRRVEFRIFRQGHPEETIQKRTAPEVLPAKKTPHSKGGRR